MNIVEALKIERKIKRRGWSSFLEPIHASCGGGEKLSWQHKFSEWNPSIEDILAEDWEVIEEKIEITKTQLFDAISHLGARSTDLSWECLWEALKGAK